MASLNPYKPPTAESVTQAEFDAAEHEWNGRRFRVQYNVTTGGLEIFVDGELIGRNNAFSFSDTVRFSFEHDGNSTSGVLSRRFGFVTNRQKYRLIVNGQLIANSSVYIGRRYVPVLIALPIAMGIVAWVAMLLIRR